MFDYGFNPNSSSGSGYMSTFDPFPRSLQGFSDVLQGRPMVSQTLVLDAEMGELVKAPARVGKKGISETKALAALKSHSEAERRRRERINAHLATLRGFVPCSTEKMDKAKLLAAVISQVKELKRDALEACKGHLIPTADDEVKVETYFDGTKEGTLYFKASICCDYRPELLSDIRKAVDSLPLKMVNAEMSTLGSRLKNEFVFTNSRNKNSADHDAEATQILTDSIHQALTSVLEKGIASPEYSPRTTLPNKKRMVTFFDSSSSSS